MPKTLRTINKPSSRTRTALTIAGSDPSGGAGLQADIKTFQTHKVYGTSVVTLLTVQNTEGVTEVQTLSANFVLAQLVAVVSDIAPDAVKTGALGSPEIIDALSFQLPKLPCSFPIVIDPVTFSKNGTALLDRDGCEMLKSKLLPLAHLITPNLIEAQELSERDVFDSASMKKAARSISLLGPKNVLIKGGHLEGSALDILYTNGEFYELRQERIDTKNTHGTGCVLSAAITANIALNQKLTEAIHNAKRFITNAIRTNPELGKGFGPVNTF